MHVYLSTSPTGDVFSSQWTKKWRENGDEGLPHFTWENITYGDWNEKREIDLDVPLPVVSIDRSPMNLKLPLIRDTT